VLVHAGAGGVGSFAIQIAHLRGAEVWTTCSARNADFCRALGAYQTIDYTREDFTATGPIFDAVLDTVGGAVHSRSAEVLKPGAILTYLSAAADASDCSQRYPDQTNRGQGDPRASGIPVSAGTSDTYRSTLPARARTRSV